MYAGNTPPDGIKTMLGSDIDAHRHYPPRPDKAARRRRRLQVADVVLLVLAVLVLAFSVAGCSKRDVKDATKAAREAGGAVGGPIAAAIASIITAIVGTLFVNEKVQHRKTKSKNRAQETARIEREKRDAGSQLLPTQSSG
jgi:hypothetical protein